MNKKFAVAPADRIFRKHVRRLIDSAQKEILVITGEIGAYRYLDLKLAVERARERNVKIKIFASKPPREIVNKLLALRCEVYLGSRVPEHYLIIDSKSWVVSKPHAKEEYGVRYGEVHLNEPESAGELARRFKQLTSRAKRASRIRWESDPLWQGLMNPPDWGVKTDSTRIEEEIYN